jgi:hypothetical protein
MFEKRKEICGGKGSKGVGCKVDRAKEKTALVL